MQKNNRTILFICPYPLGSAPSQRFRFEQYFELLQSSGFTVASAPFLNESGWSILYKDGNFQRKLLFIAKGYCLRLILLLRTIPQADYVFIHREATPLGPPFMEFLIAKIYRKKIIYDFDDAIWMANTSKENSFVAGIKWHSKVKSICRWSHKVSCGNGYLVEFARRYNSSVILNPTTVDTQHVHNPLLHSSKVQSNVITIGWTGSHSTLHYLKILTPILVTLEKKYPGRIRFLVIADRKPNLGIDALQFVPWNKEHEIPDLSEIDIGVMPLTDDLWSKGKCGLKALQYMALGIPTIASSVGVNKSIIDHQINGYLCDTPESWENHLELLIKSVELRKQIGAAGRLKIIQKFSVMANGSNFLSFFE